MSLTPSLLAKTNWDTLAEGARWSRVTRRRLRTPIGSGGDPYKLEVSRCAAWSAKAGILTLRNPSGKVQHYSLSLARVFEVSSLSVTAYKV